MDPREKLRVLILMDGPDLSSADQWNSLGKIGPGIAAPVGGLDDD